ncbi:MAG: ATP-binding protein [Alphaproteobacteria bacterium]
MLSSVSHDLKTPLASIIGSLEIYERVKDKLSEDKRRFLIGGALDEARRLDTFITNILDMLKLESGMIKAQREVTNVGDLLENCMLRIRDRMPQGAAIDIEAAAEGPVEIMTDPFLLNRAVNLVLDNAIKHGGNPPFIHIKFGKSDDQQTFISIRDKGPGIPESSLATIVSKYALLAKEDQQPACTGLGLAICYALMGLLEGHVTANNHPDGGALFTFNFLS